MNSVVENAFAKRASCGRSSASPPAQPGGYLRIVRRSQKGSQVRSDVHLGKLRRSHVFEEAPSEAQLHLFGVHHTNRHAP